MSQHNSYHLARTAAAIVDRRDRGWVVVSGADRAIVPAGAADERHRGPSGGTGLLRRVPDAAGPDDRGSVGLRARRRDPAVDGGRRQGDGAGEARSVHLQRRRAARRRQRDVSATAIVGPRAAAHGGRGGRIVRRNCWPRCPSTATCASTSRASRRSSSGPAIPASRGSTSWSRANSSRPLRERLHAAGAVDADADAAEALRIEAGVPKFHRDMDEETIPLEAGIEARAISLTKGCYVGQEVIIRVLHRGHGRVARRLVGLTLDGDGASAGRAPGQGRRPRRSAR